MKLTAYILLPLALSAALWLNDQPKPQPIVGTLFIEPVKQDSDIRIIAPCAPQDKCESEESFSF